MSIPDDDSTAKTQVRVPTPVGPTSTVDGSPSVEPTLVGDPLIGHQLGDYLVSERLGQGGMGLVYKGEQPMIGKRVAIKVLRPEIARDPEQVQRLLAEARAVNSIRHRGIIDIFNFGQLPDGRHYVVMEYLAGRALDDLIAKKGALPASEALEILDEVFAALGAGHEAGIIHRDLKPSNIFLVSQPDGSTYVKLLDFGLAKQSAAPRAATPQTRTDMFVGTPEYVAPEQARAENVGPYTDLYAAGVCAFEMLTGRLPFEATSPIDWVIKHLESMPPAPSQFVPGLPAELDAIVLRMLEKDPAKRPESAEVIRRELARVRRNLSQRQTQVAPMPVPASVAAPARASAPKAVPPTLQVAVAPAPVATPAPASSVSMAVQRSKAPFYAAGGGVLALLAAVAAYALWPAAPAPAPAPTPVARTAPPVQATAPDVVPPTPQLDPKVAQVDPPQPEPEPVHEAQPQRLPETTPEPAAKVAVKPVRATREPKDDAPSRRDLLRLIDRLDKRVRDSNGEAPQEPLLALLKSYRSEANRAVSAQSRKELARKLQIFETKFHLQH